MEASTGSIQFAESVQPHLDAGQNLARGRRQAAEQQNAGQSGLVWPEDFSGLGAVCWARSHAELHYDELPGKGYLISLLIAPLRPERNS